MRCSVWIVGAPGKLRKSHDHCLQHPPPHCNPPSTSTQSATKHNKQNKQNQKKSSSCNEAAHLFFSLVGFANTLAASAHQQHTSIPKANTPPLRAMVACCCCCCCCCSRPWPVACSLLLLLGGSSLCYSLLICLLEASLAAFVPAGQCRSSEWCGSCACGRDAGRLCGRRNKAALKSKQNQNKKNNCCCPLPHNTTQNTTQNTKHNTLCAWHGQET